MSSVIEKLIGSVSEAEGKVSEAEGKVSEAKEQVSDAEQVRDLFLDPILQVLGAKGGCISRCSIDGQFLRITRSGSCRGSEWDDDYEFPLAIFTREDSLSAAAEYVEAKKRADQDTVRKAKLAEIQRLHKELGEG